VTEGEWLSATEPESMLLYLRGKASNRKLRLFAVGCCRRIAPLFTDERSRAVLKVAEQYADGLVGDKHLYRAADHNYDFIRGEPVHTPARVAAATANSVAGPSAWAAAWNVVSEARRALLLAGAKKNGAEARAQAELLRHVLGNPMRPAVLSPSWLVWNGGTVLKMAHTIYNEHTFDTMPSLGDALAKAGCTDTAILDHCREPGDHLRGCWVLDLLLCKG